MKYGGPFPKVSRLKDIGGKFTMFSHRSELQESQTYYAPTGAWGKLSFLLGGRLAALAFRKPTAVAFIYRGQILRNRLRIEQSFGSLPKQDAALVAPPKIISHGAGFCQAEFFVHFAQKNNPNLYLTHKQKSWYN